VLVVVLGAFGTTQVTIYSTEGAEIIQEVRVPAHECRGGPTKLGAVAIQPDALCECGNIGFLETSIGAVLTCPRAADASVDARLVLRTSH
jgi:hypothetical protein